MNKPCDAHLHINLLKNDPLDDFNSQVLKLSGFNLILNTKPELAFFLENLLSGFNEIYPNAAVTINYKLLKAKLLKKISSNGILLGIKLHPRNSQITKSKFTKIHKKLSNVGFDFIVVDCFYYGSKVKSHINLELAIFLANKFTDKNILLAHGGGIKALEFMLYTRELRNIFYDYSFSINYLFGTSVWKDIQHSFKFNSNRILFGSDYPSFEIQDAMLKYKEANENSDASNLNHNFSRFLNLV